MGSLFNKEPGQSKSWKDYVPECFAEEWHPNVREEGEPIPYREFMIREEGEPI